MNVQKVNRSVLVWLWIGFGMIVIQILIGGVTRLTGSGLSITKWDIITGTIPPLNASEWSVAYELYKETPQYHKINHGMSLGEFKFIYFWEYFHRLWARLMGLVFIIPFAFFLFKKWINKTLLKRLITVLVLAAIVASFGWIMVASGLVDRPWVSAYKLSFHLILAVILLAYLFWTIMWVQNRNYTVDKKGFYLSRILSMLLFLQIFIGGMVSGMKAALLYPSFPLMKGEWIPSIVFNTSLWNVDNFINYEKSVLFPTLIHTLHRYLALILVIVLIYIFVRFKHVWLRTILTFTHRLFITLFLFQIALGILTVINSVGMVPVGWGVAHQINGILLFIVSLMYSYTFKKV
ncbi:COX15/CtaA family protein [Membranihabitans marinus]|uniref:COX15/CtaA family protein n=1 Tax=Membranihabitans marinus TaxID=1227546 RepID=UPI001F2CA1F6|nr:COX15/CtaA family protein [Membranihabitans marinus]